MAGGEAWLSSISRSRTQQSRVLMACQIPVVGPMWGEGGAPPASIHRYGTSQVGEQAVHVQQA